MRGTALSDVDRASGQSKTLSDTDDDTTTDEAANVATRRECLDEGGDNSKEGTSGHADSSASEISEGTTHEPSCNNGTDGVGGVDCSDSLCVGLVEVVVPVLGALDGVVDGCVVPVEHHARCSDERDVPIVRTL